MILFVALFIYAYFWVKYKLKISLIKGIGVHQVMTMESPLYHELRKGLTKKQIDLNE